MLKSTPLILQLRSGNDVAGAEQHLAVPSDHLAIDEGVGALLSSKRCHGPLQDADFSP
jgi:hypothetical protein